MSAQPVEQAYDLELDLRGLGCPMTMLRLAQDLKKVDVGGTVRVLSSDPACKYDIPAWGRVSGNEVLSVEEANGVTTLMVRRRV
jgi:tRNA 2-thiouridine synthesizing protein A